jgi:ABC-type uncharacterized transport system auxiliary subunit
MIRVQHLSPLVPALLLSACMSMKSTQPPVERYALEPAACAQGGGQRPAPALSIAEPQLPAGFDTERIALALDGGRRLDFYAGAAWPDRLGKTLQTFLIASACGLSAAAPESSPTAPRLETRIDDFGPVYAAGPTSPPELRVAMSFRLLSPDGQKLLAEVALRRTAPASANRISAVAGGLDELARAVAAEAFQRLAGAMPSAARRKN